MDRLIRRFTADIDADLMLTSHGIAYQADMTITASYDEAYFDKCAGYEGQAIANRINAGRVALVEKYTGKPGNPQSPHVLDIGVGSGEFIRARGEGTFGYDVNPKAANRLKVDGLWRDDIHCFKAYTFWDVLEHVPEPDHYFRRMAEGSYLFTSLPIFDDLRRIRDSKHYRPGEHLYYWTEQGFIDWMALYRFRLLEVSDHETQAGRDSIKSFAFKRDLPGYHETVGQYQEIHGRTYGASATGLYLDLVAEQVLQAKPARILDYGCGRSDLAAHFWRDGERTIAHYDPAIAEHKDMPAGDFDVVLCIDVMEHIRMEDVERVLTEIRRKSQRALFVISLKPARATLPDGRNAHVTLLTADEWLRWIGSIFRTAERVPTKWGHALMVRTW